MSKDIKTRTVFKDVKTIDKAKIASEHIHHATIKSKEQYEEHTSQKEHTPHDYAVNKTSEKCHDIQKISLSMRGLMKNAIEITKKKRIR